ncbi:MAG: homocysteine S-methyltransferase family protein [Chloroflexota bacterium]|nr:homocysteine S-methyltransferase family protein [Chloroflexota bacterium]
MSVPAKCSTQANGSLRANATTQAGGSNEPGGAPSTLPEIAPTANYAPIREWLRRGEVAILDGAIGTEILRRDVTWADHQVLDRPTVIRAIHEDYVRAGADIISTNTFQLTRRTLFNHFRDEAHRRHVGPPDLDDRAERLLRAAVSLAVEARDAAANGRPVAVAGAITTIEWCFRPDLAPPPELARAEYRETIATLADAGCDLVLIETVNSVGEAVAAVQAANDVGLPSWVAFVPNERGHLFTDETLAQAEAALAPLGPDAILLNCAPPDDCRAGLRELAAARSAATGIYPHVGRFDPPEWLFTDEYPPDRYLAEARGWVQMGARVVGGCCGTTPEHIRALASALRS